MGNSAFFFSLIFFNLVHISLFALGFLEHIEIQVEMPKPTPIYNFTCLEIGPVLSLFFFSPLHMLIIYEDFCALPNTKNKENEKTKVNLCTNSEMILNKSN